MEKRKQNLISLRDEQSVWTDKFLIKQRQLLEITFRQRERTGCCNIRTAFFIHIETKDQHRQSPAAPSFLSLLFYQSHANFLFI